METETKGKPTWALTGWVAFLSTATVIWVLAIWGPTEEGIRLLTRLSARASLTLFLLAFTASSLQRLSDSAATRWLVANRRYLGLSFAVTHTVHLATLVALGALFPDPFMDDLQPLALVGGGIGYVFIYAMAASSNQTAMNLLGITWWRRLHTLGGYYLWAVFAVSYTTRLLQDLSWWPFVAILVLALSLRQGVRKPKPAAST